MSRYLSFIIVAALASIPLWLRDFYVLHVLITTGIFIIAAMSLNLLLGFTGQLSLGHVAFFGIGAYTSALVSLGFEIHILPDVTVGLTPKPVWFAMLTGIVVAGLTGYAIGKLSFRVRGAYFVIVSISFAEVVRLVAVNWVELTQGPMALNNIPALTLGVGPIELSFLRKPSFYLLVLATMVVCYIIIVRLVNSRAGRAMIALRENESLAMGPRDWQPATNRALPSPLARRRDASTSVAGRTNSNGAGFTVRRLSSCRGFARLQSGRMLASAADRGPRRRAAAVHR